jgi:hypothetical protein
MENGQVSKYSEFLTDEQYSRYIELLDKFSSRRRLTAEEESELEYLLELDHQSYETPEYKAFADKMDAHLSEVMRNSIA